MRLICLILVLILSTALGSLYADKETKTLKEMTKLIYEKGFLINEGKEDLIYAEIISPFYRYLGDIKKNQRVDVSDIKTKFTVQYTIKQWIGEYETMKETFIPLLENQGPDIGLEINSTLDKDTLTIRVTTAEKLKDIFIEILSDIPIKISNDRIRYVLSSVGVNGQSLKNGSQASFKLILLADQDYYKVPIQITYIYQGSVYDRMFFFSFKKEDFLNADKPD